MSTPEQWQAVERAFDRWFELSAERTALMELRDRTMRAAFREANAQAWRRHQRRARMKSAIALFAFIGSASSAAGAALLQVTPTKHPLLEWLPVILVGAAVLSAFVLWRANQNAIGKTVDANQSAVTKMIAESRQQIADTQKDTAIELAKKIDREVFDLRFTGLEREMRLHLEIIKNSLAEMRADLDRNRQIQHATTRRTETGP